MLRLLRHLILGLILILTGLSGVLFWLLDTESGLQWILKQVPDLKIKSIQGRLFEEISLEEIAFQNKEFNIKIQKVNFAWQPLLLLKKQLLLNSFIIEKAHIELPAISSSTKPANHKPLEIPDLKLPVQIILQDIQLRDIHIKQGDQMLPVLNGLILRADVSEKLQLYKLAIQTPLATADLKGFLQLSKPFDLNFDIHWQAPIPLDNLQAAGKGRLSGNVNKLMVDHELKMPVNLSLSAQLETPLTHPLWQTYLKWDNLSYPLSGETLVNSSNGDIQAQGDLQHYQIKVATDLKGQQIPVSKWFLEIAGDLEKANIQTLRGELLKGIFETTGQITWKPDITWQLALKGEKLQPAELIPDLKGDIGFKIHTVGKLLENNQPQLTVNIEELAGKLRNYPINLKSELFIDKTHYFLKNLTARSGSATLQATADFQAPNVNAEFQLQANNLKEVLPTAKGKINAKGQIKGGLPLPKFTLNLNAEKIGFENINLEKLKLDLNADPLKNQAFQINLEATNLSKDQKIQLNTAKLHSDGILSNHALTLAVDSPLAQLNTQLKGGFFQNQQTWKGQLEKLFFEMPNLLKIGLSQAAKLQLSAKDIKLEQSCFLAQFKQQKAGKTCVLADWNVQKGTHAELQLSDLTLDVLKPILPTNIHLDNSLSGSFKADLQPNGTINAESAWQLDKGQLKIEDKINGLQTFDVLGGTLDLKLNKQGLQTQLKLQPLDFVDVNANITLPNFNKLPFNIEKQSIQGKIYTKVQNFDRLPQLVPILEKAEGFLQLDADLNGKLTNPQIQGILDLNAPLLQLPDLGLQLKDLHLTARNQAFDKLDIQGRVRSGEGYLTLGGALTMAEKWALALHLDGKNFEVVNNPSAWVIISPAVGLQLQPNLLNLEGEIVVPDATLTPVLSGGSGGAISISPDAKIKSKQPKETTPKSTLQIAGGIKIKLDEKISLKVADFQSRLGGEFAITFKPNEMIPLASGSINVFDGFYRAYGQDLQIRQGKIIFTGDYMSNPTLNIETVRRIYGDPAVEMAGVSIRGQAKKPEIKLFSKPQLAESKILSYVMFGNSMLEQGGNRTMQMGVYLTPELYVGYGLNILQSKNDNSQNFNIRYEFTPRWGVEAQFGQNDSGVDISYTIE
ncbi:MAG: hypothetical protein RIT27_1779 [Pseudomonadota bacterium]|jgi:translocation and assembly module TamB